MNIVVVVAGGLTEALQSAPLLAALSDTGDAPALLVCPPSCAPLAGRLLGADRMLTVPALGGKPSLATAAALWSRLRGRRLDAALVCSESAAVRAAVYLSGIPRRVGCAGGVSDRLLTDRMTCGPDGNRSRGWLGLCAPLGVAADPPAAQFTPGETALTSAERILLGRGVGDGRQLVAIGPGHGFADEAVPGWGGERYAHLANRLAQRHGVGVVLVGDERDRDVAEAMRPDLAADSVDLCGEADLDTTAAVIARCDLLVAADTPLLHLAAAVGTPSVGLFGPTDGQVRAPSGVEHRVVQALARGNGPAGLESIRVDDVLAGIESAL